MPETSPQTSNDPALFRQAFEGATDFADFLNRLAELGYTHLDIAQACVAEQNSERCEPERTLPEQSAGEPDDSTNVPSHLSPQETTEAAIPEYEKYFAEFTPDPDETMDLYLEERMALKHLYPNSLVDLGRQGIIKVCVLGPDGLYEIEPDQAQEADS
ncbi:MAG: hypothetical protein OXE04_06905 [bacterium]|nr:hypothetical protein [bacterium]